MTTPVSKYKIGDKVYIKGEDFGDIVEDIDTYYSYTLEMDIINIYLTDHHSANVYWLESDLIPLKEFREQRLKNLLNEDNKHTKSNEDKS